MSLTPGTSHKAYVGDLPPMGGDRIPLLSDYSSLPGVLTGSDGDVRPFYRVATTTLGPASTAVAEVGVGFISPIHVENPNAANVQPPSSFITAWREYFEARAAALMEHLGRPVLWTPSDIWTLARVVRFGVKGLLAAPPASGVSLNTSHVQDALQTITPRNTWDKFHNIAEGIEFTFIHTNGDPLVNTDVDGPSTTDSNYEDVMRYRGNVVLANPYVYGQTQLSPSAEGTTPTGRPLTVVLDFPRAVEDPYVITSPGRTDSDNVVQVGSPATATVKEPGTLFVDQRRFVPAQAPYLVVNDDGDAITVPRVPGHELINGVLVGVNLDDALLDIGGVGRISIDGFRWQVVTSAQETPERWRVMLTRRI